MSQGESAAGGRGSWSGLDTRHILVLAGTTEARELAEQLAPRRDIALTLSLAGRTRDPLPLPAPTRTGGFGGAEGLAAYLSQHGIDVLIDATHPFARQITQNAATAARLTGVPLIRLERPAWQSGPGDRWQPVASVEAAVEALGAAPKRVFLAIGRQEAAAFEAAPQHRYLVRSVDPVEPPLQLPQLETLLSRGPFDEAAEEQLLHARQIEVIVCKNSGGAATYGKIAAARTLGLPVVMIERPAPVTALKAGTAAEAVALLDHGLGLPAKRGV